VYLSDPEVVETLRPFVVTWQSVKDREPWPHGIGPLLREARLDRTPYNVKVLVLDSKGALIRGFASFPPKRDHRFPARSESTDYFLDQIRRSIDGLELPRVELAREIPDIDGVRIFVKLDGMMESYRTPVVEVVPKSGELWKLLARPAEPRSVEAERLSSWLGQIYPPGIMERSQVYRRFHGALKLERAGKGAVLRGRVGMEMDDGERVEGTFEAALSYGSDESQPRTIRGYFNGEYPRYDPGRGRAVRMKLTAALESRPE
jgi:hypothetical protein